MEALQVLAQLSMLVFVIGSMASMGLSLTVQEILAPLRNKRLVILALVANFILVPLVAYLITLVLPLADPLRIGLILLATAAGAPFLSKLAEVAADEFPLSPVGRRKGGNASYKAPPWKGARPGGQIPQSGYSGD